MSYISLTSAFLLRSASVVEGAVFVLGAVVVAAYLAALWHAPRSMVSDAPHSSLRRSV